MTEESRHRHDRIASRRQDMIEVLHTMNLAVKAEDTSLMKTWFVPLTWYEILLEIGVIMNRSPPTITSMN